MVVYAVRPAFAGTRRIVTFLVLITSITGLSGCSLPGHDEDATFGISLGTSTAEPVPLRIEFHQGDRIVLARDYVVAPGNNGTTPGATHYTERFTFEPGAYKLFARSENLTAAYDDYLDGSSKGYAIGIHPDGVLITPIG